MKPQPKIKRYESPQYLDFIRQLPCCLWSCYQPAEPHHWHTVGSGGSDLDAIPMCHADHAMCHNYGIKTFQQLKNIDFKDVQIQLLKTYAMQLESALYGRDT